MDCSGSGVQEDGMELIEETGVEVDIFELLLAFARLKHDENSFLSPAL
jgi:hypothetical protein